MSLTHAPEHPKPRKWFLPVGVVVLSVLCAGIALDRLVARDATYSYLRLFNEVLLLVDRNYVEETEVDDLMRGAYDGLLSSLDPESEYLTREQYQRLTAQLQPDEGDVGLHLTRRAGYVFVISVTPDSPAAEAGIRTGTRVRRIEGISTREMTLTEAQLLLRGKEGTEVRLERFPRRDGDEANLTLRRERIPSPAPVASRVGDAVVLRIPRLTPGSATAARRALNGLEGKVGGLLLLDLRGTSQGEYAEVARMAALFLEEGVVGRIRSRAGEEEMLEVEGEALEEDLRLAVLVDLGTAGPGEMLAQALRVRLEADVLGSRTFGKASLQDFIALEDGGMVRLSVARALDPEGETWDREGLEPDHAMEMDDADEEQVLLQALEILERGQVPVEQAA